MVVILTDGQHLIGRQTKKDIVLKMLHGFAIPVAVGFVLLVAVGAAYAQSSQQKEDEAALDQLRRDVESVDEENRLVVGVEKLRERVSSFKTPLVRQRVMLSIADIDAVLGREESAEQYYKDAIALAADPFLTTRARERYAELLNKAGRTRDAIRALQLGLPSMTPGGPSGVLEVEPPSVTQSRPKKPAGTIDDRFLLKKKQAEIELDSADGDEEKAFQVLKQLLVEYPGELWSIVLVAKKRANARFMAGDYEAAAASLEHAAQSVPELMTDTSFAADRVSAYIGGNDKDKAEEQARDFIERFPQHPNSNGFRIFLGRQCVSREDFEAARKHFEAVLDSHNATQDERHVAEKGAKVAAAAGKATAGEPVAESQPELSGRLFWIINGVVVSAIAVLWFVRRRRRKM